MVFDSSSGTNNAAATWSIGGIGTHGGDAGYILSGLSQFMDDFLLAFLRVNEDACKKRFG